MAKGVEELKLYLETKKNRVYLVEAINNSQKYSYEWFKAYLKLLATYGENRILKTEDNFFSGNKSIQR